MAFKTINELAKELEQVAPLLRSLIDLETREAEAKARMAKLQAEQARVDHLLPELKARTDRQIAEAQERTKQQIASFEAEMVEANRKARLEFDEWSQSAKATKVREQALAAAKQAELTALVKQIGEATAELAKMEGRLAKAKQDFARALAGAGA